MPPDRWQRRRDDDTTDRERSSAADGDRQAESSRAAARDRDDDRSEFPNKSRRLDDRADGRTNNTSIPLKPRRTNSAREGTMPALTIRGIASNQRSSSPARETPKDGEARDRKARSPDLFDRIARRKHDNPASSRSRTEGSLRSRLEGESSRADTSDPSRRPAAKLAPRGKYDEDGRRVDDVPSSSDARDRRTGSSAYDDAPTSPRKRGADSRSARDRSTSPVGGRRRYPRDDTSDSRYGGDRRTDRTRTSHRSPSPTYRDRDRDRDRVRDRPSDRYDRYDRPRSPLRGSDRYAPDNRASARPARWESRVDRDEHDDSPRSRARDDAAASSRRIRSPSPSRSDTSTKSRRRDRDADTPRRTARRYEDDKDADASTRDRPARWRIDDKDRDKDTGRRYRDRDADEDRLRRDDRRRDDRGARTPPRRTDDGTDRGHVLSRKSNVDGTQPPTGPRRQDDPANQRSVRGGGWQTVRPGSRPERNSTKPSTSDGPNGPRADRNGSKTNDPDSRRIKADEPAATIAAAPTEPPRAEPGEAYESIHQVGEGTYGQVFKARSERTGALVALKKIRMDSEKDGFPVTAMREIRLLQSLRHENIVRLHEIMVTRGSIYMIFEYMEHDLNGILAHPSVAFTAAHLKSLASQLFKGLEYLHRKAVLHRDLKGSNILLNNQGRLKLADFGLARYYAKRRQGDYTNRVVTLWYRPPELLFGETRYGSEVDMWGAGCILLELFVKKPVFTSESEIGQVTAITDILGPVTEENWPGVERLGWYEMVKPATTASGEEEGDGDGGDKDYIRSNFSTVMPDSALEVVRGLLMYDARKRWSAKQALASTYFDEEPKPELPSAVLSALQGEWHEYESRRAKRKATAPASSKDPIHN